MKQYELALALKSSLSEQDQKKIIDETKEVISKNGQIAEEKALGRKNLAYPIGKETNGVFFVITFSADSSVSIELVKKLKINEDVLRYMVEQRVTVGK